MFKFVNGPTEEYGGSLQGYVDVTYAELVETFGEPTNPKGDKEKTDAEWELTFEEGTVATIYNYKDGQNYKGLRGTPTKQITDWHVGGQTGYAVRLVNLALGR